MRNAIRKEAKVQAVKSTRQGWTVPRLWMMCLVDRSIPSITVWHSTNLDDDYIHSTWYTPKFDIFDVSSAKVHRSVEYSCMYN